MRIPYFDSDSKRNNQLRDYLTQLKMLPSPINSHWKIANTQIGAMLGITDKTVGRFLRGESQNPKTILKKFIQLYPKEYQTWPSGWNTIGKMLTVCNAAEFFKIPCPQCLLQPVPLLLQPPPFQQSYVSFLVTYIPVNVIIPSPLPLQPIDQTEPTLPGDSNALAPSD